MASIAPIPCKYNFAAKSFVDELRIGLTVYPYTAETAMLAGRIDGEQTAKGVVIPFADLLIGATALSLGFSVLTSQYAPL